MAYARPEVHVPLGSAGSGPPPPGEIDYFAPKYLVGNVPDGDSAVAHSAGGFVYIPDPGDGSGMAAALALAAVTPGDVWLRPGTYNLNLGGSPASPVTVPAECWLRGAGRNSTIILGKATAAQTQEIFLFALGAEMSDVQVTSPSAELPAFGGSPAVIRTTGPNVHIHDCILSLQGTVRTQPWMIWDSTGTIDAHDIVFVGADQTVAANRSIGLVVGDPNSVDSFTNPTHDWNLSDSRFSQFNRMVFAYNCTGGDVDNVQGVLVRPTGGAILMLLAGTLTPATVLQARISNVRISVAASETGGDPTFYGVRQSVLANGMTVDGPFWTGVTIDFLPMNTPTVVRHGYEVETSADNAVTEGGTITGCTSIGHSTGIEIQAQQGGGALFARTSDINITGCVVRNPAPIGADVGAGIRLLVTGNASVRSVNVTGSNARNAPGGSFGIDIGAAVTNTIVVANQLVPAGGTALNNAGTGTNAGLNILV